MITAPLAATRSANPGVVPPWLTAGLPAASVHAPADSADSHGLMPSATVSASPAAAAAGADHLRSQGSGWGPVADARSGVDVVKEQGRAEARLQDVRKFYARIGVRPEEGNDPAPVVFDPAFPNAEYRPEEDSLHIGVDPRSGESFAKDGDVIAHEWGHRVAEHIVGDLHHDIEDAAISESLADTFAAAYDGNFTIGEGTGQPVRDMQHPERLGHPRTVAELMRAEADQSAPLVIKDQDQYGDVHVEMDPHVIASIPNRAAAMIGTSLGTEKMASIYLDAMRKHVRPGGEIEGLAAGTLQSAKDMFGTQSSEFQATKDAWNAVGVLDLLRAKAADVHGRSAG